MCRSCLQDVSGHFVVPFVECKTSSNWAGQWEVWSVLNHGSVGEAQFCTELESGDLGELAARAGAVILSIICYHLLFSLRVAVDSKEGRAES